MVSDEAKKYADLYDDFVKRYTYGCKLKKKCKSPYLGFYDLTRLPNEFISDALNYHPCRFRDVEAQKELQEQAEAGDLLVDIDLNTKIPKDEIPTSQRGNRYIWIRFMRSYVDLETGKTPSVFLRNGHRR